MLSEDKQEQIIQANNDAFEELALRCRDPKTGKTEPDLKRAIQRMVLEYFARCCKSDLAELHRLLSGLREAALERRRTRDLNQANRNNHIRTPDPEIIRQNAAAFEQLALKWRDSITGETAYTELGLAVIYMILDYFDCDNSSGLYFGDLLRPFRKNSGYWQSKMV
jgi:hypothetical protein